MSERGDVWGEGVSRGNPFAVTTENTSPLRQRKYVAYSKGFLVGIKQQHRAVDKPGAKTLNYHNKGQNL